MTDHLPECGQFCDGQPPKCRGGDCTLCDEVDCICDLLRACEQRIKTAAYESAKPQVRQDEIRHLYNVGFSAGVDAAREAVEQVSSLFQPLGPALAAIDALRDNT